jgi:hypothetical protein
MNLYGWSMPSFTRVLGSKDPAVLDAAATRLSESLRHELARFKAVAWLRTLVNDGFPLREDRGPPAEATEGGLLAVQMETEAHAIVAYSIVRAIARPEHLDLAGESSNWTHAAVGSLYRELASCGFTKSKQCPAQYFTWMSKLSGGSPLFGDDFRSDWSFYSWFSNQELAAVVSVLQAAAEFKRPLPPGLPEAVAQRTPAELSESGKEFVGDLVGWFGQIQRVEQDAFILWW